MKFFAEKYFKEGDENARKELERIEDYREHLSEYPRNQMPAKHLLKDLKEVKARDKDWLRAQERAVHLSDAGRREAEHLNTEHDHMLWWRDVLNEHLTGWQKMKEEIAKTKTDPDYIKRVSKNLLEKQNELQAWDEKIKIFEEKKLGMHQEETTKSA